MVDRNEPNARSGFRLVGLSPAAVVGVVATSVLRFNAAPVVEGEALANWATVVTTPNDGTVVTLTKRGIYEVKLAIATEGIGEVIAGILLDASGGDLTAQPSWTQASIQARCAGFTQSVAESQAVLRSGMECSSRIYVTQAMINAGQGVLRFVAGQGGPPIDATRVIEAECAAIVRRIADLPGS